MAVLYKPYQSNLPTSDGDYLYHPRVVIVSNVSTDQIAEEIAAYSSLTSGDTKNVIDNLITVMATHLQASESVTLDGLGTFRMSMRSSGNGVEDEDDVSASQATLTVIFQPATTKNANGTVATRSMTTGATCVRYSASTTSSSTSTDEDEDEDETYSDDTDALT